MPHPSWILAPCLLGVALCSQTLLAASLVPPPGYYAPVSVTAKKAQACPATPSPYTDKLVFRSKYEGSGKARSTLNLDSERAFRRKTAAITELERGVSQQVTQYLRDGQPAQLTCALQWLNDWAEADALLSSEYNHTGKSVRKWALGSLASAYLRLKFSASQPLAAYTPQTQRIEAWFSTLAEHTVQDWSDLPLKKINNHSYWSAWSVMATAIATDRRDLFDWAVAQFRIGANQVDADGYLPNELKRSQRALAYHNYSLPPLVMIAAFAQANGVDLRAENHGALQRLAERVLSGADDPDDFARKTGEKQDMDELKRPNKYAWLAPYCTLYRCSANAEDYKAQMGPFNTFRLGGNVSQLFEPKHAKGS
ncbi:mannuronate-specific alginate lyase [Pseudomonas anguilliseptica]|uniref:mannuronate-specific alginate lyase n=1 Tax=Pseudomonas anguilliseptica TaxID=53406 RepID=UPI0022AF6CD7|nr:mannuronate-specific alginate lyase [Pseudomonas anguilliseptica]MCZ4321352.1 mannuronate-specific alginate lyase [Pseudomonas anguilliseptica]